MRISSYSVRHKSVVFFFILCLSISGFMAYEKLGKLEDPDFTIKTAIVVTPYPGASPHEVELQVTDLIEQAAQSTEHVVEIRSESRAGLSLVYVDVDESMRSHAISHTWESLRKKITAMQAELPPGVLPSTVQDDYGDIYGIFVALSGEGYSEKELADYADYLRRELLKVADVSRIQIYGDRTETIEILIPEEQMALQGIRPDILTMALSRQNAVVDSGALDSGIRRVRLETTGVLTDLSTLENLILLGMDGRTFRLGDIATIQRSYQTPREKSLSINGKTAIGITISARQGANVVAMGEAVRLRMNQLMADMPLGMELHDVYYQSESVQKAIGKFMTSLIQSVGIVVLVLLFAMGVRSGLIIASGLVLSILASFLVMLAWGIDLQRISLAALILVMGMIVDNAIVVVDGTLIKLNQGMDRESAAVQSVKETAWPLLGATIIAVLAFFPIYMAPSNTGEYCASLFQVVAIALLASWVLAITQTPVFCHQFLKTPAPPLLKNGEIAPPEPRGYRLYRKFLFFCLRHRFLTLITMTGVLLSSLVAFQHVPQNFFADSDRDMFMIDFWMPDGTRTETLAHEMGRLEQHLTTLPEIESFAGFIGSGPVRYEASQNPEPATEHYGHFLVQVKDYREIPAIRTNLYTWFNENIADAAPRIRLYRSGPPVDFKVEARFTGPDPAILRDLADQAKGIMEAHPNAYDVRDDWRNRVPVLSSSFNQTEGRMTGVERSDLGASMLRRTDGEPMGGFRDGNDILPILLKTIASPDASLEGIPVWGRDTESRPLRQVTEEMTIQWENPVIRRIDRTRAIKAQCDPMDITGESLRKDIAPAIEAIPLPPGYRLEWAGDYDLSVKGQESTNKYLPLSLFLMACILVLLFGQLRPLLIIMLTLPLSVIGIAFGLLVTQETFGFLAILGAYSLIGMLIKNAVVLLDQIQLEMAAGKAPLLAVMDASLSRLRPVTMAALTTILGMIPLLSDPLFSSMAVTIMSGLLVATVLTLMVVPVLFTLLYRIEIP